MASFRTSMARALSAASAVRYFSGGSASMSSTGRLASGFVVCSNSVRLSRTQFFGQSLSCSNRPGLHGSWIPSRNLAARSSVKRRKDSAFDNVIEKDKKVRIVNKIKNLVIARPGRKMTLHELGKHRREIGLTGRRKVISLLNKFPAVFEVFEEACNVMWVRFTPEVEDLHDEQMRLHTELVPGLVEKLRKLVMMSVDKRLTLDKIAHIKKDLGLPDDFRTTILPNFPEFFKVVHTDLGPALELVHWDPLLAVTFAEKKALEDEERARNVPKILIDGEEIVSTLLSNRKLNLPKGLNLTKKDRLLAMRFQQLPFQSPYHDATGMSPSSPEAEKRACATVHELLSLTLERKTLVDHLTHFKKDYKFSQRIRAMLIRHPEMFYVSFKGHRDSVFLREAYTGSELNEKDPLVFNKQRLQELVAVRRQPVQRRLVYNADGTPVQSENGEDQDDEESDIDDYLTDEENGDEDSDEDREDDEEKEEKREERWAQVKKESERRYVPEETKYSFERLPYAPSPRKPVKTYRDFAPRPSDVDFRKKELSPAESVPREKW